MRFQEEFKAKLDFWNPSKFSQVRGMQIIQNKSKQTALSAFSSEVFESSPFPADLPRLCGLPSGPPHLLQLSRCVPALGAGHRAGYTGQTQSCPALRHRHAEAPVLPNPGCLVRLAPAAGRLLTAPLCSGTCVAVDAPIAAGAAALSISLSWAAGAAHRLTRVAG